MTGTQGRRHAGDLRDDGLTLIEVIVAITLFGLVGSAVAGMLITGIGVSRDTRNRTAASSAASQQLEAARQKAAIDFGSLPDRRPDGTTRTPLMTVEVVVNNVTFTVTQTADWIPKNAPAGACAATAQGGNAGVQPVLLVTETVDWPTRRPTTPVTVSTVLTPPVGAYPTDLGAVNLKVVDSRNVGVPGLAITGTGPAPLTSSAISAITDNAGCLFLPFLPAGTYAVTLATSGYVDDQENASSTQSISVPSGGTTAATYFYDRAAEVDAVLDARVPPATGLPITVGNSALAGTGQFSFPGGVRQLAPLYPYSSYGIWAGRCPEAYPAAVDSGNNPLYPGAPAVTQVTPLRGAVATVTVPLYPLTVHVVTQQPFDFGTAVFTATETSGAAGTACGAPFGTYGLVRLTGASDGWTSITGLPLGTFTITASYGPYVKSDVVTISPAGGTVTWTV